MASHCKRVTFEAHLRTKSDQLFLFSAIAAVRRCISRYSEGSLLQRSRMDIDSHRVWNDQKIGLLLRTGFINLFCRRPYSSHPIICAALRIR